ncbi:bifunctional adenosylcobinamide kinase/adenosylcobinamide-phosphate guanylyltransferase [Priestia taiwanensis]|uniref:Adenosylcobinamide-phosphate guanylyltransferase n=1 Tax=Priestia taiwanensis TaxID=1347902 RepID=A0A917AIW2_9BACI|nr:bifunctional adenosylcobinamide kinase/adenosylcobinamide-phosphate guanylyltransferase [Priestia taiwanensis]MBM7361595.1 adenosyl cobinamide kinase/adenosyl cobinamide phosphate guanylyltransferase [Priestia taiwanensis]GGE55381.1 hypothetical protein GCM10007140_02180 [Priestia taiwanensis]
MQFVTGGAFQGKRQWVKSQIETYTWINGYEDELTFVQPLTSTVVLEGCEHLIRRFVQEEGAEAVFKWQEVVQFYEAWEREDDGRNVIFIGCEIGSGIVPIEAENRLWRDVVGWCYQHTAKKCTIVTTIWSGIAKQLK